MAILLLIILVIVIGAKVVYKDEFAVLTGSIQMNAQTETGSTSVNFPTGYTRDNCIVDSIMYKPYYFQNYVQGYAIGTEGTVQDIIVSLGKTDGTDNNKIYIQWKIIVQAARFRSLHF